MQRGRDEELVELLVAVGCEHVSGNGDRSIVADVDVAIDWSGGAVLGFGGSNPNAILVATCECSANTGTHPDIKPLSLAHGPKLHEVELNAELHVVGIHDVVAIGLGKIGFGVDSVESLFATIARPDIVGTYANPRTNGEVDATTYSRRLLVARLSVDIGIPHTVSPRQSALSVNAPSISAQLLIGIAQRISFALAHGLRLSAYREERCKQYAEPYSCPSA